MARARKQVKTAAAAAGQSRVLDAPVFSRPLPTADPSTFAVRHASDSASYLAIDELNRQHKIFPLPFPSPRGGAEPVLTLHDVIGTKNKTTIEQIQKNGQIVFHSTGDCGSTRGPKTQNEVADKMLSDFDEAHPSGRSPRPSG
jgi:hypothetical protein